MAERKKTNEKFLNITTNVTVKISNSKKNYFDNLAKQLCSKIDSENLLDIIEPFTSWKNSNQTSKKILCP